MARKGVVGAFQALNKHDLARFMSIWHDDCVFIYPGDIPASGAFRGKIAVEAWFRNFLDQFPKINFELQDICVRNILTLRVNNVVAVHWNIHVTNREGRMGENSGISVITIKSGKVSQVKDFIFDLGMNFKLNWSALQAVHAA